MDPKPVLTPLITEVEIKHRVNQLAKEIAAHYGNECFVMVAILKGSFIFTADLLRSFHQFNAHPQVDFIRASSYGNSVVSSGQVSITQGATLSIAGKKVLLVDDICDSGRTLKLLKSRFEEMEAVEVMSCTLMDKPSRREVEFVPDYVGFSIPDKFVIGYGLDYDEDYRDVPYIAVLQSK